VLALAILVVLIELIVVNWTWIIAQPAAAAVVAVPIVLLVALGVYVVRSQRHPNPNRNAIFLFDLGMTLVLAGLLVSYFSDTEWWSLRKVLPNALASLPAYATWAGALSGIVINLKGVYDHAVD
jgi:hypothetical protein